MLQPVGSSCFQGICLRLKRALVLTSIYWWVLSPRRPEEDCRKQRNGEEETRREEGKGVAGRSERKGQTRVRNKEPHVGQPEKDLLSCCSDPQLELNSRGNQCQQCEGNPNEVGQSSWGHQC